MNIEINLLAILLGTVSSMMIGYVWYGSDAFGFGREWARLTKVDPKKANNPLALIAAAVSAAVMTLGIAAGAFVWQGFSGNGFLASSLQVALFVWLCFQALRMFQRAQFNQEAPKATAIHISNEFVTVLAAGLIIGLLGA